MPIMTVSQGVEIYLKAMHKVTTFCINVSESFLWFVVWEKHHQHHTLSSVITVLFVLNEKVN